MKKIDTSKRLQEAKNASAIFMDLQMDEDGEYFDNHPNTITYVRLPFENEIKQGVLLYGKKPKQMQVFNVGYGLRVKKFIY